MDNNKEEFFQFMHETPAEREERRKNDRKEGKLDARDMLLGNYHIDKKTGKVYESGPNKPMITSGTFKIYGIDENE